MRTKVTLLVCFALFVPLSSFGYDLEAELRYNREKHDRFMENVTRGIQNRTNQGLENWHDSPVPGFQRAPRRGPTGFEPGGYFNPYEAKPMPGGGYEIRPRYPW